MRVLNLIYLIIMSSITLLLVLCLSVHACNARNLGVIAGKQGQYLFNKVIKEEESKAFLKEEAASKSATSGDHIIIVPSQNDLQWSAKNEVLHSSQEQEQARSLLGSSQDDSVDSKENDFAEGTVVMDYAQPHRKPPIHNEKP